ncbi:MAG: hypothetical protein A3F43_04830 [Gammaproteobacteria bacterium RIFCSPHIGHO2_12_FULL_42_10]|nr:MAG: hypothetical protein A3F43_04830 [Gammaproteobacteria bacterium RIFCSPHIGHO2_12_FULL_42_10]
MKQYIKLPKDLPNDLSGLKPGDIVFFLMLPYRKSLAGKASDTFVRIWQSFVEGEHGHKNTEHIGVVVDLPEKSDQPQLVHIMLNHAHISDVKNVVALNGPDAFMRGRQMMIYRARDEAVRQKIADNLKTIITEQNAAGNQSAFMQARFRWWMIVWGWMKRMIDKAGLRYTKFKSHLLPPTSKPHPIASATICTNFIVDLLIEATRRVDIANHNQQLSEEYSNVEPCMMLKSLQSYFHNNIHYDAYVLPEQIREKNYTALLNKLMGQVNRLMQVRGTKKNKSLNKAEQINHAITEVLNAKKIIENYQTALVLMKQILPILRKNTGHSLRVPTSYRVMINTMKALGIYPEYCAKDTIDETEVTITQHLDELKYGNQERIIYKRFRGLGYTDQEAQYEAKPTVKKWCVNHRRFLQWSIPTILGTVGLFTYGLIHTKQTEYRNAAIGSGF